MGKYFSGDKDDFYKVFGVMKEFDIDSDDEMGYLNYDRDVVEHYQRQKAQNDSNVKKYEDFKKDRAEHPEKYDSMDESEIKTMENEAVHGARLGFNKFGFLKAHYKAIGKDSYAEVLEKFESRIDSELSAYSKDEIAEIKESLWTGSSVDKEADVIIDVYGRMPEEDRDKLTDIFNDLIENKSLIRARRTFDYAKHLKEELKAKLGDKSVDDMNSYEEAMNEMLTGLSEITYLRLQKGQRGYDKDDFENHIKEVMKGIATIADEYLYSKSKNEDLRDADIEGTCLINEVSRYAHYICQDNSIEPEYSIDENGKAMDKYAVSKFNSEKIMDAYARLNEEDIREGRYVKGCGDLEAVKKENIKEAAKEAEKEVVKEVVKEAEKEVVKEVVKEDVKQKESLANLEAEEKKANPKKKVPMFADDRNKQLQENLDTIMKTISNGGAAGWANSNLSAKMYKAAWEIHDKLRGNEEVTDYAWKALRLSAVEYLAHKSADGYNKNAYAKMQAADEIMKLCDGVKGHKFPEALKMDEPTKSTAEDIMQRFEDKEKVAISQFEINKMNNKNYVDIQYSNSDLSVLRRVHSKRNRGNKGKNLDMFDSMFDDENTLLKMKLTDDPQLTKAKDKTKTVSDKNNTKTASDKEKSKGGMGKK